MAGWLARGHTEMKTYRQPVSTMDFYATFCAVADAPVPTGTKLDGVNLLPHPRGGGVDENAGMSCGRPPF